MVGLKKSLRPSILNKTLSETCSLNSNPRGGQQLVRDETDLNYSLNLRNRHSEVVEKVKMKVFIMQRKVWISSQEAFV